jgi:hypothetical protein
VLELNDKFDYLVYLFLKSQRIKKEESKEGGYYISTQMNPESVNKSPKALKEDVVGF